MNRHQPNINRYEVGGTPTKIYEPSESARSIATVFENHGSSPLRLLFTDTGSEPDPDKFITLHPGQPIETNPPICVYAYSPSGAVVPVVVVTGVRYVGATSTETGAGVSAEADQLAEARGQKQLLADIVVRLEIGLRYLAEIYGEELGARDALVIR